MEASMSLALQVQMFLYVFTIDMNGRSVAFSQLPESAPKARSPGCMNLEDFPSLTLSEMEVTACHFQNWKA